METDKPYILLPCSGRKRLNISEGHLYRVQDRISKEDLGFITEQVAKKNYGEENYFISGSTSLCPICSFDNRHSPVKLIPLKE